MSECCTYFTRWYSNRFRGLSTKEHVVFWVVVAVLLALNFTFLSLELQALENAHNNPVSTIRTTYRSADKDQLMPREYIVTAEFVSGGNETSGCVQWINATCYHGCTAPLNSTVPGPTHPPGRITKYIIDPTGTQVWLLFGASLGSKVEFESTANGNCYVPGVSVVIYPKDSALGPLDLAASSITVLPTTGLLSALSVSVSITTSVFGNKTYSLVPALTGAIRVTDVDWITNSPIVNTPSVSVPTPDSALLAISFPVVGCPLNPANPCFPVTETSFSYGMSWRDVAGSVFALINISITALVFLFPYRAVAPHRVISLLTDPQTPAPLSDKSDDSSLLSSTPHQDVSATAALRLNSYYQPPAESATNSDGKTRNFA